MTIMVGVILVSYLLCTLPAIVVQELHSRGRSFDRVGNLQLHSGSQILGPINMLPYFVGTCQSSSTHHNYWET